MIHKLKFVSMTINKYKLKYYDKIIDFDLTGGTMMIDKNKKIS